MPVANYIQARDYFDEMTHVLQRFNRSQLQPLVDAIRETDKEGRIVFTAGNGGSNAIASHMAVDFVKAGVATVPLGTNPAIVSMFSNDLPEAFTNALTEEFATIRRPGDLLIVFSVSGTSQNAVKLLRYADAQGFEAFLITHELAPHYNFLRNDHTIRIPSGDYGVVEDMFAIIAHYLVRAVEGRPWV